jgi:hypothetical protein
MLFCDCPATPTRPWEQKPTIPVSFFLVKTLQHAIVETSAKRGALRELVDSYASMDPVKGILMLDFEKFSGVMEVLDPHASEERRVSRLTPIGSLKMQNLLIPFDSPKLVIGDIPRY